MEELRTKHKTLQNAAHHIGFDCIHPQAAHGSPYHVHPYPSPVRLQHAFQPTHNSSNMFHPKGLSKTQMDMAGLRSNGTPNDSPILGRALCFTPRGSPIPGRVSHLSDKFQESLTLTSDTDAMVAKISAMFPTVSETHIKILLKKYYNREAVVISALQVEKHPITTPGPLSMSPSVSRLHKSAMGVYSALQLAKGVSGSTQMTPLTGTPHGSPSLLRPASGASSHYGSPRSVDGGGAARPHPSPKMKLRYLKSVFPKAEETLILDVLANKDNNVQKASEELLSMGFAKKEAAVNAKPKEKTPNAPKKVVHIMKTPEEKESLKQKLQKKYKSIAPRVVSIALESVDYNEDRAEQILSVVLQEDTASKSAATQPPNKTSGDQSNQPTTTKRPAMVLLKGLEKSFQSRRLAAPAGADPQLRRGPQDTLLLEEYVTWKGPNPELRAGVRARAEGAPAQVAHGARGLARGADPALRKGSANVAKGTIYHKLSNKPVKMCI